MNKLVSQKNTIRPWGILPFQVQVSFADIIKYWEKQAKSPSKGVALQAQEVLSDLGKHPELRKPILDIDILNKKSKELRKLLSVIFPEPLQKNEIKAGSIPFTNILFNPTTRFQKTLENAGSKFKFQIRNTNEELYYIHACIFILNFRYGVKFKSPRTYFVEIPNEETKNVYHYRVMFNGDFSQIEPVNPKFSLSKEDIELLRNNAHNIEIWKEIFPPNSFVFKGFGVISLYEVTMDKVISDLKTELLHPDIFQSETRMRSIKSKVSRILEMPDLELGMFTVEEDSETVGCFKDVQFKSLVLQFEKDAPMTECFCSYGNNEILSLKPIFFTNLTKLKAEVNPQVQRLAKHGIRSYVAIPVRLDNGLIGAIEFGSPHINEINSVSIDKIMDIIPIFTVTMQRWMVEHETIMESIVQQNFTVIHPSVEWKFFEVAEKLYNDRQTNGTAAIEDIVLKK